MIALLVSGLIAFGAAALFASAVVYYVLAKLALERAETVQDETRRILDDGAVLNERALDALARAEEHVV